MVIKLNILDIEGFLETVNACKGKVQIHFADGGKMNINGQYQMQNKLREQYRQNKNCLPLVLSVPEPSDYMSIVSYYAGDC